MMQEIPVQVLLATFNGSRHLEALLESIVEQDSSGWSLLVRDDCSTDATPEIIERFRSRLGPRMQVLSDSGRSRLGVVGNFSQLLSASTASYVMFADQDDIWHRNKISLALTAMCGREAIAGAHRPILVHTDLTLVDENDRSVASSYWRHQGIVPARGHALGHMMVENIASGCTSMLNRPLVELAGEVPPEAHLHDWWVSLVAAAFGEIVSLPQQTIDWRRHGANDSDITNISDVVYRTVTKGPQMHQRLQRLLEENRSRVRCFLDRYRERLSAEQIAAVTAFLNLPELGFFERRRAILRHRLFFTSWARTAGLLLLA